MGNVPFKKFSRLRVIAKVMTFAYRKENLEPCFIMNNYLKPEFYFCVELPFCTRQEIFCLIDFSKVLVDK